MKPWEEEMTIYYNQAKRAGSYDIERMFLTYDKIAQKALADKTMKNGSSFTVPVTDGTHYRFKFKKEMTEIYVIDALNYLKRTPVLEMRSKETMDQYRSRLTTALKTIGVTMKAQHNCFGERFPEKLQAQMMEVTPGMVVSFTNGPKYVCTNKQGSNLSFRHVYSGSLRDLTIAEYKSQVNTVVVDIASNRDMQKFFLSNCKDLTQRMEMSVSFLSDAKKSVDNIEQRVLETKTPINICMGIANLIVKPSRNEEKCNWFDINLNKIEKEDVITLRALMDCSPYERNYVYKKLPDDADYVRDAALEQQLENLTVQKKYDEIYSEIMEYVAKSGKDLVVEMLHFNKQNDNFIPTCVYFAAENGKAKALKATFVNNNFANDEEKISELTMAEFQVICDQIYHDKFLTIHTRTEELALMAVLENSKNNEKQMDKEEIKSNKGFKAQVDKITENRMGENPSIINIKTSDVNGLSGLVHEFLKNQNERDIVAKDIIDDFDER